MTTPNIDIELVDMPWAATGKFPDTVQWRRPVIDGKLTLEPGITDIQVTWPGTAKLNVFLEDSSRGSIVSTNPAESPATLSGKTQYFLRAVVSEQVQVGIQGFNFDSGDIDKTLGLRFFPTSRA